MATRPNPTGPPATATEAMACYAICAPGVERLAATELDHLGARVEGQERGGIPFTADLATLYRVHLHALLLHRVVVRIATFRAGALPELFRRTRQIAWEGWLAAGSTVDVRATSHQSRLYHTGAIAERVALAVAERLAESRGRNPPGPDLRDRDPAGHNLRGPARRDLPGGPNASAPKSDDPGPAGLPGGGESRGNTPGGGGWAEPPPQLLLARLDENRCTLSLDASGALLHRRGYRLATGRAPLRESLACAVLALAGWRPGLPLLDPMCGAGTFAIEAARQGLGIAPGVERSFAFQRWRTFDTVRWAGLVAAAEAYRRTTLAAPIHGSDRDPRAVVAARANAARAGVATVVTFDTGDLFNLTPTGPAGVVVLNPPYGRRIGGGDATLYRRLGDLLRDRLPGYRYAVVCPTPTLADATRLSGRRVLLTHGGQRVVVAAGRLSPQIPDLRPFQ